MLNESIKLMASTLADKKVVLDTLPNSVLNINTNIIEDGTSDNKNEVVDKLAMVLGNQINYFRNKLIPVLKDYTNGVTKIVNNKISNVVIVDKNIKVIDIPDLLNEYVAREEVGLSTDNIALPITTFSIPKPDVDTIKQYLRMEAPALNDMVNELLEEISDDRLSELWDTYLINISNSNDAIATLRYTLPISLNEITLLFTLVSNLRNKLPEGLNVNIDLYNKVMPMYYRLLANTLSLGIKNFKNDVTSKKVIIKVIDNDIYVYGPSYRMFLKDYTPEVIFGLIISTNATKSYYLSDITIHSESYLSKWNQYIKMKKLSIDELSIYRNAYIMYVDTLYKDTSKEVMDDNFKYVNVTEAEKEVTTLVKNKSLSELKDIMNTSKEIVTGILLDNNNFKVFVNYMNDYIATNKDIKSEEAASLALVDMVIDYLLMQIKKV